jgi:hypothetical protein
MRRLLPVVIVILSVVAFLPALDGEFLTRDDDVNVLLYESYRNVGRALCPQGWADAAGEAPERAAWLRSGAADAERQLAQFRADPGRPRRLR